MKRHLTTVGLGALLAAGLVILGVANSTAQQKAVPPPQQPPPAQPKTPPPADTPTIANATDLLNQNQIQDLLQALNNNPQALQNAQRLTEQLRASGRIRADQQVVGFMDGKIFVATATAAAAVQLPQQAQNLFNGLTGLNLQNFNVARQQVVNATDLLNQNQIQDLINALNSNPQALQMAQRLTDMLRATGKLQPNQQVVGFADGKI